MLLLTLQGGVLFAVANPHTAESVQRAEQPSCESYLSLDLSADAMWSQSLEAAFKREEWRQSCKLATVRQITTCLPPHCTANSSLQNAAWRLVSAQACLLKDLQRHELQYLQGRGLLWDLSRAHRCRAPRSHPSERQTAESSNPLQLLDITVYTPAGIGMDGQPRPAETVEGWRSRNPTALIPGNLHCDLMASRRMPCHCMLSSAFIWQPRAQL